MSPVSHINVREVLHVAGVSGVGKKTLIARLLDPAEVQLRTCFGIIDGARAFGWSFEPIADVLRSDAAQIIHQWQWLTDGLIEECRRSFPEAAHRVVVLRHDPATIRDRLAERRQRVPIERIELDHAGVVDRMRQRRESGVFDVSEVDMSLPWLAMAGAGQEALAE